MIGQAVLGGFTVKGALDYGWVMGHFALSMLILVAAVLLVFRASRERESARRRGQGDRTLVRSLRGLVALGALAIFAGTAATASGPHAGGSPGQKINRLNLDGHGTMDFVIHRHAEIALVFSLLAVGIWWLARRRGAGAGRPAPADGAVRAAGRPGCGRARPVRDPPPDRARVGPRGACLLRLGGRDLVRRSRRGAPADGGPPSRPSGPSNGPWCPPSRCASPEIRALLGPRGPAWRARCPGERLACSAAMTRKKGVA